MITMTQKVLPAGFPSLQLDQNVRRDSHSRHRQPASPLPENQMTRAAHSIPLILVAAAFAQEPRVDPRPLEIGAPDRSQVAFNRYADGSISTVWKSPTRNSQPSC